MNERHASLRADLRALPRGAWILFFGTFLNRFGTFVMPFLVIYMTRLGFASTQAGLAIGAYGGGTLGACLLGPKQANYCPKRRKCCLYQSWSINNGRLRRFFRHATPSISIPAPLLPIAGSLRPLFLYV